MHESYTNPTGQFWCWWRTAWRGTGKGNKGQIQHSWSKRKNFSLFQWEKYKIIIFFIYLRGHWHELGYLKNICLTSSAPSLLNQFLQEGITSRKMEESASSVMHPWPMNFFSIRYRWFDSFCFCIWVMLSAEITKQTNIHKKQSSILWRSVNNWFSQVNMVCNNIYAGVCNAWNILVSIISTAQ